MIIFYSKNHNLDFVFNLFFNKNEVHNHPIVPEKFINSLVLKIIYPTNISVKQNNFLKS